MLSVAARHVPAGLSVNWKIADAQLLPFDDDQFDVVLCQQGLQFVPDRQQAITQMRRVLRSEGVAAVAVWASIDRNWEEDAPVFRVMYWRRQIVPPEVQIDVGTVAHAEPLHRPASVGDRWPPKICLPLRPTGATRLVGGGDVTSVRRVGSSRSD
jgi:SAM-dependent methyltransferase